MTNPSLSSIASNIVGQYSKASNHLVGTYRSGAQRLVTGANTRYASLLKSGALPLVAEDVQARLFKAQTQITGLVEHSIITGSNRAEQAIYFVAGGVNRGIQRMAAVTDRVETKLDTQAITKTSAVAILPIAQISLTLAALAAEGTKRLSDRVALAPVQVAPVVAPAPVAAKAKAKRAVKKGVRSVKVNA